MNKLKTVDNYINAGYNETTSYNGEVSHPAIAHDVRYNEMLFDVVCDKDGNRGTLVYSEVIQQFTSVYNVPFEHSIAYKDNLYLIHATDALNTKLGKWNVDDPSAVLLSYIKFVVNPQSLYNNVYDIMQIAGRLYGGNTLTPI
jgi:hypothetical protein